MLNFHTAHALNSYAARCPPPNTSPHHRCCCRLQVTLFVALLAMDANRQKVGRIDCLCCFTSKRFKAKVSQKHNIKHASYCFSWGEGKAGGGRPSESFYFMLSYIGISSSTCVHVRFVGRRQHACHFMSRRQNTSPQRIFSWCEQKTLQGNGHGTLL